MTFDNFLTHFDLSYNPSFEEYKRDFKIYLSVGLTINLDTSRVHNKNKNLWTEEYKNNFIKASYEAFIVHKLDFLKSFYDKCKSYAENGKNYLKTDSSFEKSYMTDLLQGMIDEGYKIRAIPINNGWLELDSYNDYLKYQKMFENETISKFFNPYTS